MEHVELGGSWNTFDALTQRVAQLINPPNVLDIGAGAGKYAQLLRPVLPHARLTALEADAHAHDHLIKAGYDDVRVGIASDLYNRPTDTYDLVILGDVIEHMRHSEGRDLLEFLVYRSSYLVIVTPECMPMSLSPLHAGHNSIWRPAAMAWHDLWAHQCCGQMHFYLLRGYLNWQAISLHDIVQATQGLPDMVSDQDNLGMTTAQLTMHDIAIRRPTSETGFIYYRPF